LTAFEARVPSGLTYLLSFTHAVVALWAPTGLKWCNGVGEEVASPRFTHEIVPTARQNPVD